ncbi:VWA domain-containing protein [Aldersonia sp. NBC_00410]|uniref:nitric oxide reductase activation protein NorD n=1 Tax=Aldersonia sp. NBC_00410 TaxID=2975954 RepID=UPI0022532311|nr:VWA domain-containing protein [Aldersonia sp. NBC_00410]MCX5044304.1 VWA domain-containing protein [Aldersonia sp. NBC_00410]
MQFDQDRTAGVRRWELIAGAVAGRPLRVLALDGGEAAWTDGSAIYVDPGAGTARLLESVTVQASLLAAGSLDAAVLRRVARRTNLTRRYLAVEGHRALACNEDVLPPAVRPLVDWNLAARSDSPTASLALASSDDVLPDPPSAFGAIRPRQMRESDAGKEFGPAAATHAPRRRNDRELAELDDETGEADILDIVSSPVSGGGGIGRLLQRMLGAVRKLGGEGGTPGADTPSHRLRSGARGGGPRIFSTARAESDEEVLGDGRKWTYPEWDAGRRAYRPDWCTVLEAAPPPDAAGHPGDWSGHALRRPLARLGVGIERRHRQFQGDDIDLDAAVEARVEALAGTVPDEAVYIESVRRRRDLAVLVLLDVSGSAGEPGAGGTTVHDEQRAAAAAITMALHELGDRVALYAYNSQGRSSVWLSALKRFDDNLDELALRRLAGLMPAAYSRLGAAVRHGTAVLEREGGASRRLLVVLSDGLAYDHGYERAYGSADVRRALAESRARGIGCLCLTIGAGTDTEDLRRAFGSAAHATIPRPEQLSRVIAPLFRSALSAADMRRRIAQRHRPHAQRDPRVSAP